MLTQEFPFQGDEISPLSEQVVEEDPHWNTIIVRGHSKHS